MGKCFVSFIYASNETKRTDPFADTMHTKQRVLETPHITKRLSRFPPLNLLIYDHPRLRAAKRRFKGRGMDLCSELSRLLFVRSASKRGTRSHDSLARPEGGGKISRREGEKKNAFPVWSSVNSVRRETTPFSYVTYQRKRRPLSIANRHFSTRLGF